MHLFFCLVAPALRVIVAGVYRSESIRRESCEVGRMMMGSGRRSCFWRDPDGRVPCDLATSQNSTLSVALRCEMRCAFMRTYDHYIMFKQHTKDKNTEISQRGRGSGKLQSCSKRHATLFASGIFNECEGSNNHGRCSPRRKRPVTVVRSAGLRLHVTQLSN